MPWVRNGKFTHREVEGHGASSPVRFKLMELLGTLDVTTSHEESRGLASRDLIQGLARRGTRVQFSAGEIVFREGDSCDAIYILVEGQLKVFSADSLGREVVFNILQPGELVGEMLLDGGSRSASVKAIGSATCVAIGHQAFRDIVSMDPDYSRLVIEHLIARLRKSTMKIRSFAFDGVYERVTGLLNELALESQEGPVLPSTLTQQEIANRIGASREMVNYVIRDLIKGGFLVRSGRRSIQILRKPPARW